MQQLSAADEWWAMDFGCAPGKLRPGHTRVQAHTARLAGSTGIWILVTGGAPLASLPADVLASHGERAKSWTSALVSDESQLVRELAGLAPGRVGKVVGPAPIHYGSSASLDLRDGRRAMELDDDEAAVQRLRDACGTEWDAGGSDVKEGVPLFGVFDEGRQLAALAGYQVWNGKIAHIAIVTHPDRRGRGFARAAVARAAEHALGKGLLPQYRTLRANDAGMAVAKRLGFVEYGFSVYVRMRAA